jgi:hypothetical protein
VAQECGLRFGELGLVGQSHRWGPRFFPIMPRPV